MRRFEISPHTRRGTVRIPRVQARREENPRAEKATWQWAVEMVILGAGVLVALLTLHLGLEQLKSVNAGLSSSAAAAVYQQQQDINNIFVQYPEMDPYFSDEKYAPEGAPDRPKMESVAFRILDHFEHIRYQLNNGLFETSHDAWETYIRSSFSWSPILCEMLWNSAAEYDGTGDGTLWKDFAASSCAKFGIGP